MKVLHVESGRHLYGGPVQVLLLLRGLQAKGVENVLVCPADSAIAAADPAAELRTISMGGDLDLGMIARLRRIVNSTQPDVIHLHSRRGADWIGGLASLRLGVPVVLSRRVDNREPRLFATAKYALVDQIIAISEGIKTVLLEAGIRADKVKCVTDAVPPMVIETRDREWFEQCFGVSAKAPLIGVVAQLIPRKGHRYLIDALPGLLAQQPDLRVVFFGRGPEEKSISEQLRNLGLQEKVVLAGFRDDLERILPCLDLVVHPALSEGLGVAILQAMQAGLALVATRVGGIPEAVIDGETGILVAPADSHALGTSIGRLLADTKLSQQMGDKAKTYVARNFSVDRMVNGNLAVYHAI